MQDQHQLHPDVLALLEPVKEELLRSAAWIIGSSSAAQQCLDVAERLRKKGKEAYFYKLGDKMIVTSKKWK